MAAEHPAAVGVGCVTDDAWGAFEDKKRLLAGTLLGTEDTKAHGVQF